MSFRIGRTLPPAAAPISLGDIAKGIAGHFGGGKTVKRFEEELREYYQVGHSFTVSSGKAALVLILQALHDLAPERDEVLIPAYTCYSVPSAIVRAGLRVRLCDVATETLDLDYSLLEKELENPRILCVLSTHLFGLPADVKRVKGLVKDRGIFVVEDAAQAMGAEWNGDKTGVMGDVGLFSTGRGKAFTTVEGGVILTDNDEIGQAIGKRLASLPGYGAVDCLKLLVYSVALAFLIHPNIFWLPRSMPFLKMGETYFDPDFPMRRLSPFQAGLATGWRSRIGNLRNVRGNNVKEVARRGISPVGIFAGKLPDLIRYPVLLADAHAKQTILQESGQTGLGIVDGYPDSIDGIEGLAYISEGKGFPGAKEIAERLVTLPVHPYVKDSDIRKIVQLLKDKLGRG